MPDWVKLTLEQLTSADAYASAKTPTASKAASEKPAVEIKLSSSGDTVELRTHARIDRKRGGFLGIGHKLWRLTRWLLGDKVTVKTIEQDREKHSFDKAVDTLVEDLAEGLMDKSDFLNKLDEIGRAGGKLQKTCAKHSLDVPTDHELAERFGDNLALCLLGLRRESPTLFRRVMANLEFLSAKIEPDVLLSKYSDTGHKNAVKDGFHDPAETLKAYKTQIDPLVEKLWVKPRAAFQAMSALQASTERNIN